MPKREKIPVAVDGPKYLTVVHPYPLYANLEVAEEQKQLAHWLAACTGQPDAVTALFHKPRVRTLLPRLRRGLIAFL